MMENRKIEVLEDLPRWKVFVAKYVANHAEDFLSIILAAVAMAADDESVYNDLMQRILKENDKNPDTVPTLFARLQKLTNFLSE